MKIGDVKNIYEDPLTMKKLEGKAKLVRKWAEDNENSSEYWEVKFLDRDGFVCDRWIKRGASRDVERDATKEMNRIFNNLF